MQGFAFLMILGFALQAAFAYDIPKNALQAYERLREFNGSKEAAWRTAHLDADSVHAYDVLDASLRFGATYHSYSRLSRYSLDECRRSND